MKKPHLLLFVFVLIAFNSVAQWEQLNSGTTKILHAVYFSNSDTVVVAGQSGIILRTTDGGANWTQQNSGTSNELFSLSFANADTGYAVGRAGTILKTTDGGINWTSQNSGTTKDLARVHFLNTSLGYVVGDDGIMLKTTNGGASWDALPSVATYLLEGLYFTDDTTGYATGVNSTLLKTTNGGETWGPQDSAPLTWLQHVFFPAPDTGFICDPMVGAPGDARFLKTTNGGLDWEPYGVGLIGSFLASYFINTDTGYFVGNGTIYKTTDGGNTMVFQDPGTQYQLRHVWFTDAKTGYAVGVHGTILKTTTGGINVGINEQQQSFNLKIYPNPTIDKITIELSETINISNTSVSVYGIDNKELIYREVSGLKTEIDISSFPAGVYFIKLISSDKNTTLGVGKFVRN
jgi:photosystem II stability/assembly factor-like uncharacterized protein